MKRIIASMAIVLAIILMTLSLQSCFTPFPEGGYRGGGSRDRNMQEDMRRLWP